MGDAFEILGMPRRFGVGADEVERAYLSRVAGAHPDVVGGDDESARRMAELNEAKRALLDDERRANVLLASLGGASADADKTLPPGFLMEMMDVRERMDAEVGAVPAQSQERAAGVARWRGWGRERRAEAIGEVRALFERAASASGAERSGVLREIRVQLNAWRYIERLLEQVGSAGPM